LTAITALEEIFRLQHGLVLGSLARALGDLDLAEEALSEAMAAALESWPEAGTPANPGAWLITVAKRKAVDRLRRERRLHDRLGLLGEEVHPSEPAPTGPIGDERLALVFACCHPALAPEAQMALTLKALGGLTTAEVARAFLVSERTMFQRITRAKRKIKLAGIPLQVPEPNRLGPRIESVLAVIYLIFNEGYSALSGPDLIRAELSREAIELAELMAGAFPTQAEVVGLASMCWLIEARRPARIDPAGELVLLADQDRTRWDREAISRGLALLGRGRGLGPPGFYLLQAEIAALHATSPDHQATDWTAMVDLYRRLWLVRPSAVVALNHAAALAMAQGPAAGLARLESLATILAGYSTFHAARAELLVRAGRPREAAAAFGRALEFPLNQVERRHLQRRLRACRGREGGSA
jgi:RNA polymerase sigma-70 factor (ECF subfamily)